jgi:hypothetical protein
MSLFWQGQWTDCQRGSNRVHALGAQRLNNSLNKEGVYFTPFRFVRGKVARSMLNSLTGALIEENLH